MAGNKNISFDSYRWGHFGAILFHIIIAFFIIYFGIKLERTNIYKSNIVIFNNNKISVVKLGLALKWIGIVFGIVSLLSLWPIFTDKYDSYTIT